MGWFVSMANHRARKGERPCYYSVFFFFFFFFFFFVVVFLDPVLMVMLSDYPPIICRAPSLPKTPGSCGLGLLSRPFFRLKKDSMPLFLPLPLPPA